MSERKSPIYEAQIRENGRRAEPDGKEQRTEKHAATQALSLEERHPPGHRP
jgi:hypothetical protein